jgi:hypothetical protein
MNPLMPSQNFIWLWVALAAIFSPTSYSPTDIAQYLAGAGYAFCFCFMLYALVTGPKIPSFLFLLVLWLYVLFCYYYLLNDEVRAMTDGSLLTRSTMCLFLICSIRNVRFEAKKIILVLDIIFWLLLMSFATEFTYFTDFFANYYTYYWSGLVSHMFAFQKPVSVFALHSVAGFAAFLILYTYIIRHSIYRHTLDLFNIGFYFVVLFMLSSFTSLVFLGASFLIFFWHSKRVNKFLILALLIFFAFIQRNQILDWLSSVVSISYSGPQSRYLEGTPIYETISYITGDGFYPVGFGFVDGVLYGDSGVVELVLRVGWLGLLLAYTTFWLFIKRNCINLSDAVVIFSATLAFESGHSALKNLRVLGMILLTVVLLNHIRRNCHTSKCVD